MPDRIRQAAEYIDYALRRMPRDMGESREPGYRVWYGDVLGVRYFLDETRDVVNIVAVAPARR